MRVDYLRDNYCARCDIRRTKTEATIHIATCKNCGQRMRTKAWKDSWRDRKREVIRY